MKSLKFYQGTGYGVINKTLRDHNITDDFIKENFKKDEIINHIHNINNEILKSGKQEKITLYRGFSFIDFDTYTSLIEKGFSSCTTNINVATKNYTNNGCCVLVFTLASDIDAYVFEYEGKYKEDEYLLRRNIEFFNISFLKKYNGVKIYTCNIRPYKLPTLKQNEKFEHERSKLHEELLTNDKIVDSLLYVIGDEIEIYDTMEELTIQLKNIAKKMGYTLNKDILKNIERKFNDINS